MLIKFLLFFSSSKFFKHFEFNATKNVIIYFLLLAFLILMRLKPEKVCLFLLLFYFETISKLNQLKLDNKRQHYYSCHCYITIFDIVEMYFG